MDRTESVLHRVHRLIYLTAGAGCLTVSPLRLELLDVRRVTQHDLRQLTGRLCRENLTPEPSRIKQWQKARMVDMRMC